MKLYTYPNNPRANKALIAAEYAGVQIETAPVTMGETNKTKEFLALNPWGKVPTLQTEDNQGIWESNAIARYVAHLTENTLFGRSKTESGQVEQWIDWVRGDLELATSVWLYPIYGIIPNNPQATGKAQQDIKKLMGVLNNYLKTKSYLVGERVTLADIVVACHLVPLYTKVFDTKFRKGFQNVTRWFLNIVNQPNFKKVQNEVTLCTTMEEAKEVSAAPAAEAPKENPAPAANAASKKKKKNPLDELPPSSFSLDEWKTCYANAEDTRGEALKYLWENFDPAGFSLWICDYKYNDELGLPFMSCNLMGGYIQRLDSLRKYGMGCIHLFGSSGNSAIAGCFLVRGVEIPEELSGCPDSEVYDFRKVDLENAAEKALFEDLLCWDGEFGGKYPPFNQGKLFI